MHPGVREHFAGRKPNTEERWLAEAFFGWRQNPAMPALTSDDLAPVLGPTHRAGGRRMGPTGPLGPRSAVGMPGWVPVIADLNYAGEAWNRHWRDDHGAVVLTEAVYRGMPRRTAATRLSGCTAGGKRWRPLSASSWADSV